MTKAQHRAQQANKPCGPEGLLAIRKIAAEHQYDKVNETAVDAFTAGIVIQIYDALNDANKLKLEGLPVYRVLQVCLAMLKKR